jgi:uncharacterized protein (TIGR03437 family)
VPNEFNLSNTRGTIAMALSGTNINSGTDQWFFNLADNSASLDAQKFTVFGKITGCSGLAVMDRIAATPVLNGGAPFDTIPLLNYKTGAVKAENFVQVSSITPTPAGTTPTLVNAASYGCLGVSPGELLTVYGDNIGPAQFTTKTDSNGLVATSLAGTRVLFDGTPGPMLYTSAGQASVVVPYNVAGKTNVSVSVEYLGNATAPLIMPVTATDPAIFTQNSSGLGDGAILRQRGSVVDLINTANPAQPGDALLVYGHGYGAVTAATSLPDGTIIGSALPVPVASTTVLLDGTAYAITPFYAGAAPGIVNGVMQVNFFVPSDLAPGSHSIQLKVGNVTSPLGVNLQTQ